VGVTVRTNTDPTVTFERNDPASIDEINFPGALSVERMSSNHFFAVVDGVSFDIKRTRKGAKWRLIKQ
jgi:hypothetical protein